MSFNSCAQCEKLSLRTTTRYPIHPSPSQPAQPRNEPWNSSASNLTPGLIRPY